MPEGAYRFRLVPLWWNNLDTEVVLYTRTM
jgi:hypothetical protein